MSVVEESPVKTEQTVKFGNPSLKQYRQKLMTIKARIKYPEHAIKGFRKHLKNGTFPKRMKSIKPYPKMQSSEAQAAVNAACDQVQCVILDQMLQEGKKKLSQDQDSYKTLKEQREAYRQKFKLPKTLKKPMKPTIRQLQQGLAELQSNYAKLCKQLENSS